MLTGLRNAMPPCEAVRPARPAGLAGSPGFPSDADAGREAAASANGGDVAFTGRVIKVGPARMPSRPIRIGRG